MSNKNKSTFKLIIKKEFGSVRLGYNNKAILLKDRDDHELLMDIALLSQDPSLLQLFENIPTEKEWSDYKAELYLLENPENNGENLPE